MKNRLLKLKDQDLLLAAAAFSILVLGLVTIFSSTLEPGASLSLYARNQLIYAGIGLLVLYLVSRLDYRIYRHFMVPLYIVTLGMLALVLFVGKTAYGATSWINLGAFQFEPSELAKVFMILILAHYFARHSRDFRLRHIVLSGLMLLPALILLYLQPDLGTAIVFVVAWFAMLIAARPNPKYIALLVCTVLIAAPLAYKSLKGYQKSRFTVFISTVTGRPVPADESLGIGYNVIQSQIAVGDGSLLGRGLGRGTQSALKFLPIQSQQTDFIFAVYAEQLGFVGSAILIGLFGVMVYRIFFAAEQAKDAFGSMIAIGIGTMLLFHVVINIGFNMGIMPVTGIPLPLMSYGGTALVTTMILLGVTQSVYAHRKEIEFAK